jgi:hypothetical protein
MPPIAGGHRIIVDVPAGQELHHPGHAVQIACAKPERLVEELWHRRQHPLAAKIEIVGSQP